MLKMASKDFERAKSVCYNKIKIWREKTMDSYISQSFDKNYAFAWSMDQGGFSSQLAKNLHEYINKNKLSVKSCLDICCGTGEFLAYMQKQGVKCSGTEVAKSMIEYCSREYPTMSFALAKQIYDIPVKGKFDLISCNHDMVNMIEQFQNWQELFKSAYKALEKNGIFVFDFYTKNKLENWNEVIYEQSDKIDHVKSIKTGMDNKCIMNEVYYNKNNEEGFKTVQFCDFALSPVDKYSSRNRIHVIAKK